jgi:hypothetical protein
VLSGLSSLLHFCPLNDVTCCKNALVVQKFEGGLYFDGAGFGENT